MTDDGLEDVMVAQKNGIIIEIEVSPGSKRTEVRSVNPWRKRLEVAVRSPPKKGAANKELVDLFSGIFGVAKTEVEIVSGHKGSSKNVAVYGITSTEALEALRKVMHG